MSDEEIRENLLTREIETMEIQLLAGARRTIVTLEEYISVRLLQGASKKAIYDALIQDLNTGGRIFGEFRNSIRATSNAVISRSRDTAVIEETGMEERLRWVAVLDERTCPDCNENHGKEKTWGEWERDGLPRTGATVCRNFCRCILAPVTTPKTNPIRRSRKR